MTEQAAQYCTHNPLQSRDNPATMDTGLDTVQVSVTELVTLERMLTPLLNQVRTLQGKRPVIVPKG